jgi:hypothetical protein
LGRSLAAKPEACYLLADTDLEGRKRPLSELLGLAPYAALGVFLVFVVYPVVIAGSTIRFSAWATLAWTLATLAWLVPVGWAQFALPSGAQTISIQLGFLAVFCLFGLVLIMVVAWRLNAVGKTRWLAVLTPFLPFSLILIGYICLLPGDTRQLSRAQRRAEKAQARAEAKARKAATRAHKQAHRQAHGQMPSQTQPPLAQPRLAASMNPAMPPLPDAGHPYGQAVPDHGLPPLRATQPAAHTPQRPAPQRTPQQQGHQQSHHQRPPAMPPLPQGPGQGRGPAASAGQPPRLPQGDRAAPHHQAPQQAPGHHQASAPRGAAPRGPAVGMPPPLPPKRRS